MRLYKIIANSTITHVEDYFNAVIQGIKRSLLVSVESARELLSNITTYNLDRLPVLYQKYAQGLADFFENQSKTPVHTKLISKIFDVFTSNLLNVLKDKELPLSIKELLIDKMPQMADSLMRMYSRPPQTLLVGRSGQRCFEEYEGVGKRLKNALVNAQHSAGITYSPRSIKLFAWVREALRDTANPLVGLLLEHPKIQDRKSDIHVSFEKLFDIVNLLVLQIACGDDIADNIKDKKLTKIFADIPFFTEEDRIKNRKIVQDYQHGIFLEYFDKAVEIWKEAIQQLKDLFGESYFESNVKNRFLELHSSVMGSLTYSQFMNSTPHDPSITQESISKNLDPNIMVECVRMLEGALVQKFVGEAEIGLPSESDLAIVQEIIKKSQKNAAYSNAAATAPREQKENDISSPVPFALNDLNNRRLAETGKTFVEQFNQFLAEEGYQNHFFSNYSVTPNPEGFDYVSLLMIRRVALSQGMQQLSDLKWHFEIPSSDYNVATFAIKAIELAEQSEDEAVMKGFFLKRLKQHIELIDKFSDKLLIETDVQNSFFKQWEQEIQIMYQDVDRIENPELKKHAERYVDSWELFLCMYLLFKRAFDGTV